MELEMTRARNESCLNSLYSGGGNWSTWEIRKSILQVTGTKIFRLLRGPLLKDTSLFYVLLLQNSAALNYEMVLTNHQL